MQISPARHGHTHPAYWTSIDCNTWNKLKLTTNCLESNWADALLMKMSNKERVSPWVCCNETSLQLIMISWWIVNHHRLRDINCLFRGINSVSFSQEWEFDTFAMENWKKIWFCIANAEWWVSNSGVSWEKKKVCYVNSKIEADVPVPVKKNISRACWFSVLQHSTCKFE